MYANPKENEKAQQVSRFVCIEMNWRFTSHGTQQWPAEIPYICNDIIFWFFYDHLNIIRKIHNIQNLYPVLFAIKNILNSKN